jgi:hypothetical protein
MKEKEMGRTCYKEGDMRDPKVVLEGRLEGNSRFGRLRRCWEDNIKICHQEVGWEQGMN